MVKSVAVISFGHKANSWVPAHLAQIGMVTSAADEIWDLRTMMSDPLTQDRVTNGEDGSHDRTQIAVFGQESFMPAIGQMTDSLLDAYISNKDATLMSIMGCVTGAHRADTLGKAECDMLNACTHSDGTKVFHAMHFTMTRCNSKRECEHAINQAWKWAEEGAWCDVPHVPFAHLYGEVACRQRPESSANWTEYRRLAERVEEWIREEEGGVIAPSTAPVLTPETPPNRAKPSQPVADDSQPQESQLSGTTSSSSPQLNAVWQKRAEKRVTAAQFNIENCSGLTTIIVPLNSVTQ